MSTSDINAFLSNKGIKLKLKNDVVFPELDFSYTIDNDGNISLGLGLNMKAQALKSSAEANTRP